MPCTKIFSFGLCSDVLASGHEEALVAAVATFKNLIKSCVDDSLIKQGVDQITVSANAATRKSGPTVIEKVCVTIESLLGYHYEAVWDMSFQILSTMFDKLGNDTRLSAYFKCVYAANIDAYFYCFDKV